MTEIVTKADLAQALEAQANKMTVRLGGIVVTVAGVLFALLKLT